MPENKIVTKHEVIRAGTVKNAVGPAVEALKKVDASELGLSLNEGKVIAQAVGILSKLVDDAQAAIDAGDKQFQGRDMELINRASNRFFRIGNDIDEAEARQRHAKESFLQKTAELRERGFTTLEIKGLVTNPDLEIEAFQQKIDALIAEKAKIEQFLADAPRFDPELLIGTAVEVESHETAEAA